MLFIAIQTGNKAAFDALFHLYYGKLLSFARNYVQSESAEEIVSELFVALWIKRDILAEIMTPEVYLYVSVKNACLNLIRYNKKRQKIFRDKSPNEVFEHIANTNGLLMEDKELMHLLDLAVARLPEQRQIIFRLIKDQGLKSNAVAQILGISKRTVENQLYKALKSLAIAISDYLGYHPQNRISRKQLLSDRLFLLFFTL